MRFDDKVIWITGASSGIGKGLAMELSKRNCKLIISSRHESKLIEVRDSCEQPENIAILTFDLAKYDGMQDVVKKALRFFGRIDVLVNNAGISQRSLVIDTDIIVDKRLMEVDYLGTVALSKALLPNMVKAQSGHFVVISSVMGKFSSPYRSGYCGAKHALHGFFDALRMEHEKDNIKVTMICPGFVNTDIAKNALTADGSKLNTQDEATAKGLTVTTFVNRMLKAVENEKFEAYIGRKEILGVYLKRLSPKLLHRFVLKNKVR